MDLQNFLQAENIPNNLKYKIEEYAYDYMEQNDNQNIINLLNRIHPVFAHDLSNKLFGPTLLRFDIFKGASRGFIRQLSMMVRNLYRSSDIDISPYI